MCGKHDAAFCIVVSARDDVRFIVEGAKRGGGGGGVETDGTSLACWKTQGLYTCMCGCMFGGEGIPGGTTNMLSWGRMKGGGCWRQGKQVGLVMAMSGGAASRGRSCA